MYKADADSIKFNGKKVKADPATFKILDERFATDKATVFYEGRPQKGVLSVVRELSDSRRVFRERLQDSVSGDAEQAEAA